MADKNKTPRKEKPIKMPALFKKPIKEKIFEKNFIKKIHIDKDKEFLRSVFVKNAESRFVVKENLAPEDLKRLKTLAKAIKINRAGAIDTTKVTLLLIVAGGILAFNILFKNALVKAALQNGLESIFNAKAEVTGVRFEILSGRIGFKSMTVADESSPMKNLFELGKTEISISVPELIKGKFVAKNIECQEIRWGTDRRTSGALRKNSFVSAASAPKKNQKSDQKPFLDMNKIDVKSIIASNENNLKSMSQISNSRVELEAINSKWTNKIEDSRKKISDASKSLDDVRKIDMNSIRTIDQAQSAIQKVNTAIPMTENLVKESDAIGRDIASDGKKAEVMISDSKKSIDGDVSYIQGLIKLPSGGVKGLVTSIAGDYIKQNFGKFYNYIQMGEHYLWVVRGNPDTNKKAPEPSPVRRGGYNVPFPTTVYPGFLLQNLGASVGKKGDPYILDGNLKDLSSDPDLWGKPTTFNLDQLNKGQEIQIKGVSDGRKNASEKLGIDLAYQNIPFEIKENLGLLQAKSIRGIYRFNTGFHLDRNNRSAGIALLGLKNIQMELSNPDDLISKAVFEAIRSTPEILIQISYQISSSGSVDLSMKSNLDDKLSKMVGGIIGDLSKKYEKEIRAVLMSKAEDELKKNDTLYTGFKKAEELSKGNLKDAGALKAEVDKKKKELDDRINGIKKQAEDKVKQEAGDKVNDVIKKLPPAPKLPGF